MPVIPLQENTRTQSVMREGQGSALLGTSPRRSIFLLSLAEGCKRHSCASVTALLGLGHSGAQGRLSPPATEPEWDIVKTFWVTETIRMRGDPLVGLSHEFPTSQRRPTTGLTPNRWVTPPQVQTLAVSTACVHWTRVLVVWGSGCGIGQALHNFPSGPQWLASVVLYPAEVRVAVTVAGLHHEASLRASTFPSLLEASHEELHKKSPAHQVGVSVPPADSATELSPSNHGERRGPEGPPSSLAPQ